MSDKFTADTTFKRRTFLTTTIAGASIFGMGTVASQDSGDTTYNVGYKNEDGLEKVEEIAIDVDNRHLKINVITVQLDSADAEELSEAENIRYVETDRRVSISSSQASTGQQQSTQKTPWGINAVGASDAHVQGIKGNSVDVAILDSGIDSSHEDLSANIGEGKAFVETECKEECKKEWDDDYGHGTHVAGTVGAIDNDTGVIGVAPEATLHAVKVFDQKGVATMSAIVEGLLFVGENEYDVANMSFGFTPDPAIKDAVKFAAEKGVLLVGAAGNFASSVDFPASSDEVIAVSAMNEKSGISEFSTKGQEIELIAPGSSVLSTRPNGNYQKESGTSMAAPHVSGIAALLMMNGDDAETVGSYMKKTAVDLEIQKEAQGSGLVTISPSSSKSWIKTSGSSSPTIDIGDLGLNGS